MEISRHNERTLAAYEAGVWLYAENTEAANDPALAPNWQWIDQTLSHLPAEGARILEVGSATGRDALYIEQHAEYRGHSVQRTDATAGFVQLLREQGYAAAELNVLVDEIPGECDLILANAVFPHFDAGQTLAVLQKFQRALAPRRGITAFSCKLGVGEEWVTEKLGTPRFIHYWTPEEIIATTEAAGLSVVWTLVDAPGQYNHRWIFVIARADPQSFEI